ncbi:uncharacterized protein LOC124259411 isoform X2 [Haliotis rubra]|uniref:uncharacterized protein LOC124259411 isoform X2 n=1 Tax=Haliotis rubra TaxID=36100 RepID=UPI001EE62050|nr:uncharacterized protein LOC124259411 isoform X2 [Haliotis rubra]
MNVTMAGCVDMDVLPLCETPVGEETLDKHGDNIIQNSVSGQADLVARDVLEFMKHGDSLRSCDCGDQASLGTHKPDTGPCGPLLPNCSVMQKEEEADDGSAWGQGMEIVTSIGDEFCSGQVQAIRHLEDSERNVTDVFSQKEHIREAAEATEGGVTDMSSQKEDIREAVEATEGGFTDVSSQKEEDIREAVEASEGDVTDVSSQKEEDIREAVEATEGDVTDVSSQKEEDIREAVEATEGGVTDMSSQKEEDIREAVEATEGVMEDMLSQKKEGSDILDIDCTEHAESDKVTVRESDELYGANHIHIAEVEPASKVQVGCNEKVFSQNKNDETVPGVCVLKEGVGAKAKEDITDFPEPTGENKVTETAFVPPVCCGFGSTGNHGQTENSEEVTPVNEDVEYCKDVQQCLIPQQPAGGCPTDTHSEGVPAVSGVVGAWSDQQGQDKSAVAEEKTSVVGESHEHSFNTGKQILMVSSLDSDCVLMTDDECVADQICEDGLEICNTECSVKPFTCDADGDDCAGGGEDATSTESVSNETDCVGVPVGAPAAPPGDLGYVPVVCGDRQPHFDLSDTFNMFAEEEHLDQFVTENIDQRFSSQDVPSVVNVRQNAVSARAKKRKKEKAKLEKLLSRSTTSRAARARRYAASFQELLANKADTFHPDFTCPVCLDLYHKPHVVHPCQHMFCEPCLRKLPSSALADNAVCPLCRQDIRACVMDVDLHLQLSEYYSDIYIKRARQEKKLKTNQKPLPRIQTRPLSQQLIRHILSNQSNRRTDGNALHMVLCVCLSAVLSLLYVWMNIPIEITSGPLRNAAVSNVWVQAICLFCALMWLFAKGLGKLATRERR